MAKDRDDSEILIPLPLEGATRCHGTLRLRLAGWEPDGRPIVGVRTQRRHLLVRRKRRFDKNEPLGDISD